VAGETGQVVRACVHIDPSDPLFAGHYPGFPILPGLYVVDHVDDAVSAETGLYLAALDRAKFVAPVRPGDDLRIEAILTGNGEDVLCAATVFTDSGVVAELRLRYQATRPGGES
jgi:3-hydroxyacyl-[acyl-carrier-protein] dehydratase